MLIFLASGIVMAGIATGQSEFLRPKPLVAYPLVFIAVLAVLTTYDVRRGSQVRPAGRIDLIPPTRRLISTSIGRAIPFATLCTLVLMNGVLLLIPATSSPVPEFVATVIDRPGEGNRGCLRYVAFYNEPLHRKVRVCARVNGTYSLLPGDTVVVHESVGPLGGSLLGIDRIQR